ncbi:MAG: D-amino acid aminotransferase [Gammaproteobacteria bacterium]
MQVFLNGQLVPKDDAKISVFDRGFLFGDGVYEVIPVFGDNLFRLTEHLARLNNSLAAINIKNPYTHNEWKKICNDLMHECDFSSHKAVYIQITRGVGVREHLYHSSMIPTVFVMCNPISANKYDKGISAITHADIRWMRCDIKAITLLPNILLRQYAKDADESYEAILIRDNNVTEGAASNVFAVKDNIILTPPIDGKILQGITRDLLVELMLDANMQVNEKNIPEKALFDADEIWLTGSTTGVAPVLKLNGKPVGNGKPGIRWQQANELFNAYISTYKN